MGDTNQKLDEMARALNEADSQKKRLDVEKQDLDRQIEEGEAAMAGLNKSKISLTTQLEDTKRLGDAESRDRSALLTKFKNLSTDLENTMERIEDEHQRKSDALKGLSKAQAEIQLWRSRFETEGLGRVDELESARGKLQARIQEAEENVETLSVKIANGEKSRARMQTDLEELSLDYERTHAAAIITEKRGKNFDKVIGEWKAKADDIITEVDASQKEGRNYNSELYRLKAAHDEEVEKEELQSALEEAEAALEQEENKVLRSQLELG